MSSWRRSSPAPASPSRWSPWPAAAPGASPPPKSSGPCSMKAGMLSPRSQSRGLMWSQSSTPTWRPPEKPTRAGEVLWGTSTGWMPASLACLPGRRARWILRSACCLRPRGSSLSAPAWCPSSLWAPPQGCMLASAGASTSPRPAGRISTRWTVTPCLAPPTAPWLGVCPTGSGCRAPTFRWTPRARPRWWRCTLPVRACAMATAIWRLPGAST